MTFNLVTEEGQKEDAESRQQEAEDQGAEEDNHGLGADLPLEQRLIDELTIICCSSEGDAVLLTFLEQEHIEGGLHILLTPDLREDTLLDRRCRDTSLEHGILRLDALTVDIGRATSLHEGSLDGALEFLDGGSQRLYLRSLLTGSLQQAVTILDSLVVAVDEVGGGTIGETDVRGDDLILVLGVVDIFTQVVEHLDLGVGLGKTGRELVGHLHRLGSVCQGGHGILLLELLDLALSGSQLCVDLCHTVVDELLCAQGDFVLVGIGLAVVADVQLTEHIHTTAVVLVLEGELGNRGLLGSGSDGELLQVVRSHLHGGTDGDEIGLTVVELTVGILCDGEYAQRGLERRGKGISPVDEGFDLCFILHGRSFHHIFATLAPDLHLEPLGLLQEVDVKRVEVLGIEIHIDRLGQISNPVDHTAFCTIFGIKLEILDDIAEEHTRLEYLYLVLDSGGVGQEAKIFNAGQHLVGVVVLLVGILDEHTGRDFIDGLCVAEVDEGHAETDDE